MRLSVKRRLHQMSYVKRVEADSTPVEHVTVGANRSERFRVRRERIITHHEMV